MNTKTLTRTSRKLSLVLRHKPEVIGLKLDASGWAEVSHLLAQLERHGTAISRAELQYIVDHNDKQRFRFSEDGLRIRANQGHSIEVELGLRATPPPKVLYHGTARRFVDSILRTGLERRSRQHVHLSDNLETAIKVGGRHGKPVVFHVRAAAMAADGHTFFRSDNGVWLTEAVPTEFLRLLE
ncbi:RNA 2'-phosphotransferase [Lewinella sp. W8]|uniref:RNA 2'-phosphotransferase n=1 Tax=Lewinella sp. W8 TaxID=2528208 RepID=UPI0010672C11|nr:RNA 2'-phosphotransferase [Lewinella sp. W8]MTB52357.1 RNA 2'-phosphotransferase [Lewinella sp. W8]